MLLMSSKRYYISSSVICRTITCSSTLDTNLYMTLGLTPAATQDDIKKAYFELCKKYHPDKNNGSVESAKKFREITQAYETLGSEQLRKKYDGKMMYSSRMGMNMNYSNVHQPGFDSTVDERAYYRQQKIKKRFKGKTWYFNFDAWTNSHYPHMEKKERPIAWRRVEFKRQEQFRNEHQSFIFTSAVFISIIFSFIGLVMVGTSHLQKTLYSEGKKE